MSEWPAWHNEPERDPRWGRRYRIGATVEVNTGTYSYSNVRGNVWQRGRIVDADYDPAPVGRGYDWGNEFYRVEILDTGEMTTCRPPCLRRLGESYPDWGH